MSANRFMVTFGLIFLYVNKGHGEQEIWERNLPEMV